MPEVENRSKPPGTIPHCDLDVQEGQRKKEHAEAKRKRLEEWKRRRQEEEAARMIFSEEETMRKLQEIRIALELSAWTTLQNALADVLSGEVKVELRDCIQSAIYVLYYEDKDSPTAARAVQALRSIKKALAMCRKRDPLHTELYAASVQVRDCLSVRIQLQALPMGDQKKYEKKMMAAYGGHIDGDEHSRFCQSFRKTIWKVFKKAFNSKAMIKNDKRANPRERRVRSHEQATQLQ